MPRAVAPQRVQRREAKTLASCTWGVFTLACEIFSTDDGMKRFPFLGGLREIMTECLDRP